MLGAPDGFVRGAKVALANAGGEAGRFTVQFATKPLPSDADGMADAVEEVVRDVGTIAVVGDFDTEQARVTAPLLNAVGLLQVDAGAPAPGVAQPAARRTYFGLGLPGRLPAPPGYETAFGHAAPGAGAGYVAMRALLSALRAAGGDAARRSAVIDSFSSLP